MFWLSWTAVPSVHWISPVLAAGFFGFAQLGCTLSVLTYLADAYGLNAGVTFQALNFLRFGFAAAFPLFAEQSEFCLLLAAATRTDL